MITVSVSSCARQHALRLLPIGTLLYILAAFGGTLITALSAAPPAIRWWRRRRARTDSAERVAKRLRLRNEIQSHLPARTRWGNRGEAIIRDVHRVDEYPDINERGRGISSWFKVELKDEYHRGMEVFLSINYVRLDRKKHTWEIVQREADGDPKGFIVGRIPLDWIVSVDWEGDEFYGSPHIYCRFIGKRRQPYEEILVYYKDGTSDFLWELQDYKQAPPALLQRLKRLLVAR